MVSRVPPSELVRNLTSLVLTSRWIYPSPPPKISIKKTIHPGKEWKDIVGEGTCTGTEVICSHHTREVYYLSKVKNESTGSTIFILQLIYNLGSIMEVDLPPFTTNSCEADYTFEGSCIEALHRYLWGLREAGYEIQVGNRTRRIWVNIFFKSILRTIQLYELDGNLSEGWDGASPVPAGGWSAARRSTSLCILSHPQSVRKARMCLALFTDLFHLHGPCHDGIKYSLRRVVHLKTTSMSIYLLHIRERNIAYSFSHLSPSPFLIVVPVHRNSSRSMCTSASAVPVGKWASPAGVVLSLAGAAEPPYCRAYTDGEPEETGWPTTTVHMVFFMWVTAIMMVAMMFVKMAVVFVIMGMRHDYNWQTVLFVVMK